MNSVSGARLMHGWSSRAKTGVCAQAFVQTVNQQSSAEKKRKIGVRARGNGRKCGSFFRDFGGRQDGVAHDWRVLCARTELLVFGVLGMASECGGVR